MAAPAETIIGLGTVVQNYKVFLFSLMPILKASPDQIEKLLQVFYHIRHKGKIVGIVDNVSLDESAYSRFLENTGVGRNSYQHIITSMGHLQTFWEDASERLHDKVFVLGDYRMPLQGYERVASPLHADWVLCGDLQDYHVPTLRKFRHMSLPHVLPFFCARQEIDYITLKEKKIQNVLDREIRLNQHLKFHESGFPISQFLDHVRNELLVPDFRETLFISHASFDFWSCVHQGGMDTLSIAEASDCDTTMKMLDLRW